MAESKAEQAVEALRVLLAGIVGDGGLTYWLTPSRVVRRYDFDESCLEPTLDTVYLLVPDEELKFEETNHSIRAEQRVSVVACSRFEPISEAPFDSSAPLRWTLQNRMVQDIEKKLRAAVGPSSPFLGGLAENVEVERVSRGPETFVDRWAVAFLSVLIRYSYRFDTP